MRSIYRNYVVDAVLLIIMGLLMFVKPDGILGSICALIGVVLLIMGGIKLIGWLAAKDSAERSSFSLFTAVVQLIFGIMLFVKQDFFIGIIPFIAGIIVAYGAVVSLIGALRRRKYGGSSFGLVMSVITLILAVIIILHPAAVAEFLVQLIGASMLIEGITLLAANPSKRIEYR